MARGDYGPEIRTSMGNSPGKRLNTSPPSVDSPAEMRRDAARGIKQDSAADIKDDAAQVARAAPPMRIAGQAGSTPNDLHHVLAATSIAHAILAHRGGGGGGV